MLAFSIMRVMMPKEQFVTDVKGKRLGVLVDLRTYQRLREAEEDLADIRAYDKAVPRVQADVRSGQFLTLGTYEANRARRRR